MDQNRFLTWLKKLAHDVLSNIIAAIVVVVLGIAATAITKLGWWATIGQFLVGSTRFPNWALILILQVIAVLMIVAFRMKTTEVVPPTSTYEKAPVPTARPNFEIAGIAQERVVIHPVASFGATHIRNNGDEKPVLALIFRIENVPGSAALEARDVIAKISFRSLTGHEEEQIQYGVWLDTVCNSVDLDLGDTRELVVVMPIKGTLYAIEDRRTLNHDYHAPGAWFALKKVDDLESVEVRIIDPQAKTTRTFVRRLSFDGEHFHIGPDQIRA